jgi:hypothetical protein
MHPRPYLRIYNLLLLLLVLLLLLLLSLLLQSLLEVWFMLQLQMTLRGILLLD